MCVCSNLEEPIEIVIIVQVLTIFKKKKNRFPEQSVIKTSKIKIFEWNNLHCLQINLRMDGNKFKRH